MVCLNIFMKTVMTWKKDITENGVNISIHFIQQKLIDNLPSGSLLTPA